MAFTGKFGTIGSMPGDMILGGKGPVGGGGDIDVDASSAIALDQSARSGAFDVSASSSLALTQTATTPVPWHVSASSPISANQALTSSIKMASATSSLAITQTAEINIQFPVATSALSLTQEAKNTTVDAAASSPISLVQTALPGLFKPIATTSISLVSAATGENLRNGITSALTITQTVLLGGPKYKSASSPITVTNTAVGIGPIKRNVVDTLTLTDLATSSIRMLTASDVLTLDTAARKADTFVVSASSSLTLDNAATGFNNRVTASSTLALIQVADTNQKQRSVTDSITVAHTATADTNKKVVSTLTLTHEATQGIITLSVVDTLDLTDEARNSNIRVVVPASTLELTQTVRSSIRMLEAANSLDLVQTLAVQKPIYASASSPLITTEDVFDIDTQSVITVETGLGQSVSVTVNAVRPSSNIISFAQTATQYVVYADAIAADAESTLAITQEARLSKQVTNELQVIPLTQSAMGVTGREARNTLDTLDVVASVNVVRGNITASNTLEITHAVSFIFEKRNTLCTYSPFVGTSTDPNAPTPPPSTYTAPGATPGFRLQYPATGPVTDEVLLRSPNTGNVDRLSMVRINRETRGGTLIVYADPIWPKVQTLLLSFSGLSFQQGQDLMEFMETHIGEEIRLIDYEDRVWRGVITNPQDPVVQDGKGCRYTASYEFEGEKV
jgi:hypothetical protein